MVSKRRARRVRRKSQRLDRKVARKEGRRGRVSPATPSKKPSVSAAQNEAKSNESIERLEQQQSALKSRIAAESKVNEQQAEAISGLVAAQAASAVAEKAVAAIRADWDEEELADLPAELQEIYAEAIRDGYYSADEFVAFFNAMVQVFDDRLDELELDAAANDVEHDAMQFAIDHVADKLLTVYEALISAGYMPSGDFMTDLKNGVVFVNERPVHIKTMLYGIMAFRGTNIVDSAEAGTTYLGWFQAPEQQVCKYVGDFTNGDDEPTTTHIMLYVDGGGDLVSQVVEAGEKWPATGVAFRQFTPTLGVDLTKMALVMSFIFGAQFLPRGLDWSTAVFAGPALAKILGFDIGASFGITNANAL